MRKLKLIWDFRGSVASKTAEHHAIHLKDYVNLNKVRHHDIGIETLNDFHSFAYLVIDEVNMIPIRDALKPHRGQLVTS